MIKTIMPGDYDWSDQQAVLFDVGSRGLDRDQMQKRAAAGIFNNVDIQPKPGRSIIHLIALGDAERYGCYFAGAPVQTPAGQVPIESMKVGDLVLTHKNRYRPVTCVYESEYSGVRARIKCVGLPDPVTATSNHPFMVVRGSEFDAGKRFRWRKDGSFAENIDRLVGQAAWVSADQIRPGDYMVIPVGASEELAAPKEADPYVLGLYVAEGCLVKEYKDIYSRGTYGKLLYTLSTKDGASIDYLQTWYAGHGRDPVELQPSYTSEYGVRLAYGLRDLAQYVDVAFGHLAETKHVHPSVFGWPVVDRFRFLAGYFDGDGCVDETDTKYAGTLRASTVSRSLALDMQRLCASVGVAMSVSRCFNYERHRTCDGFGKGGGDRVIYSMGVGSSQSNLILNKCLRLRPHSHESKYGGPSLQTSGNYALVRVDSVMLDEVSNEVRYNLEVDEDNSYLVDVQGHNSNRNADFFYGAPREIEFPEPRGSLKSIKLATGNADQIWTWTKYAKVYRDHKNKKTDKSYGDVLKAAHNRAMARTELLIDVPNDDPVWRDDIEKVANGEDIFFSMSCFPAGTLVRTARGLTPIETVTPDDVVWTHAGRYCRVTGLMDRDAPALCRISVVGMAGVPLFATPEHPIYAARFSDVPRKSHLGGGDGSAAFSRAHRHELHGQLKWVPAEELSTAHYVAVPLPISSSDCIDVGSKWARLMGYYMAEGSLIFNGAKACTAQFTVHKDDQAVLDVETLADWTSVSYAAHALSDKCTVISAHGTTVADRLYRDVGRAAGKSVPGYLFKAVPACRLEFVVGWFNGDGWQDSGGLHWSTVELTRALDLQLLLASIGIPAAITKNTHDPEAGRVIRGTEHEYVVSVSNEMSAEFAAVQGCKAKTIDLKETGHRREFISGNYLMLPVRAIEYVDGVTTVYNMSVDVDNTYTVNNLAVHNCKVPGDFCSICGNFSKSRKAKDGGTDCRHIKHQLSCLSKSGHRVGMINDHMVFFDISRVRVPADRIAYSLLKVAGLGGGADMDDERSLHVFNVPRISGEDDPLGLYASKLSEVLHKLSNIEKQIEAVGRAPNESLSFDPSVMRHLSDDERAAMGQSRGDIGKVLAALADKKICLSLPDFVKLILGERAGGYENSIRLASDSLPGVFSRLAEEDDDDELPESAMDEGEVAVPRRVSEMIEAMKGGMSLDDEPVARRVTIVAIRKLPAPDLKKAASVYDETADKMLRAYAAYKVAWCLRNGIDSRVTKLAVLQHYVGSN